MAERHPLIEIDLDAIRANAECLTARCAAAGIAVAGVTKGVCGSPRVARALVEGGVRQLADSRLENLARLRENGLRAELMLLRLPMPSEAEQTVRLADASLNSEFGVIRRLADAARRLGRTHKVVLMIELGDLREGVDPSEAEPLAVRIAALEGVHLAGVGANLTCFGGVVPTPENLGILAEAADRIERALGHPLDIVSGGNTSSLPLVESGRIPGRINHLRLGESLLLGLGTPGRRPIEGTRQDAFTIRAECIEVQTKGSVPAGLVARDAFGTCPSFSDRGPRRRAILALGREDILLDDLTPLDPGVTVLGASSDHLLADVQESARVWMAGDVMSFRPGYGALLAAMTSPYVAKRYRARRAASAPAVRAVAIIGAPSGLGGCRAGPERAPGAIRGAGLRAALESAGLSVQDAGDVLPPPPGPPALSSGARHEARIAAFSDRLADEVARQLAAGRSPIMLGGDHSITLGMLAGVRRARPHLAAIFFDAHADFNTERTSPSRNAHGMVVAACVGLGPRPLVECGGVWPKIEPESLAWVGLRDLDPGEREALARSRARVYTMEDVDYRGIRELVEPLVREFAPCSDGLHVSFDLDVLDPDAAPGVTTPVPGGISVREAYLALEILSRSGLPLSMDIVELNPDADPGGRTAALAAGLAATLFGKRILRP